MDNAIIQALRNRVGRLTSLSTPQDGDAVDVAADIGAGFVPGVGTALSVRDFERARREGDRLGMGLSAAGMIPIVGGVARAAGKARKGAKAADAAVEALRKAPQDDALRTAQQNAVRMLGLPPDNTPMDRARAMGFDTPAVHFSRHGVDVRELDSGKFAVAPFDAVGTHVGSEQAALERFQNTVGYKVNNPAYVNDELKGVSYPVIIRRGQEFLSDGRPWAEDALSSQLRKIGGHDWNDINGGRQTYRQLNDGLRSKLFSNFDSIPYVNDVEAKGAISYIVPPHNIRSRFAAFDPARVNENDIMGFATPAMLGTLALGSAGTLGAIAALRQREEEPKKPQKSPQ